MSESMVNETTEVGGECFSKTLDLRWLVRDSEAVVITVDGEAFLKETVLQQAWRGDLGTIEWRDVETVDE